MTAAQTKAVRNRYRMNFGDLPPLRRPAYRKPDAQKSARRLAEMLANIKRMQSGRSKS